MVSVIDGYAILRGLLEALQVALWALDMLGRVVGWVWEPP